MGIAVIVCIQTIEGSQPRHGETFELVHVVGTLERWGGGESNVRMNVDEAYI